MPVDEVIRFTDIKADSIHEMVARGMIPQMPTDARKIHDDLFTSRSAAKMAYHRAGLRAERGPRGPRLVTNLNRYSSIRDVTNLPGLPSFTNPPAAASSHVFAWSIWSKFQTLGPRLRRRLGRWRYLRC